MCPDWLLHWTPLHWQQSLLSSPQEERRPNSSTRPRLKWRRACLSLSMHPVRFPRPGLAHSSKSIRKLRRCWKDRPAMVDLQVIEERLCNCWLFLMNSEETKHSHIYSICFDSTIWTQYQDSFHFYLLKSEIHNFCIKNCFFKSVLFKLIEILIPLSPWSFVVSGNWKKRQIMKDWETTVNSILFHWPKTASSQFEKMTSFLPLGFAQLEGLQQLS